MTPSETEIDHFLVLYLTKHFSRAALKLGVTQPTLTQSIARLESKLKISLFFRTKQGCMPTEAVALFYDKALKFKTFWEEVSRDIILTDGGLTGSFRLGCHQSVGGYILPPFFNQLTKTAPKIEFKLFHDLSRRIVEKIINYELDFGFVINPVKHPDLVLIKLGNDTITFWKSKKIINPPKKIFADLNLFQVQTLLSKKTFKNMTEWQLVETNSLELIRSLITEGAGIGILPGRVANTNNQSLELFNSELPVFHDEIYGDYRVDVLKRSANKVNVSAGKNNLLK